MSLKKTFWLAILYGTLTILLCVGLAFTLYNIYCKHTVSLIGSFTSQANTDVSISQFLSGQTGSFKEGLNYLGKEGYSGNYSIFLVSHLLPAIIMLIVLAFSSILFMFVLIKVTSKQIDKLETAIILSLSSTETASVSMSARLVSALQENKRKILFLENTRNDEQKKQNQYWQDILHQIKTPLSSLRICCENSLDEMKNYPDAIQRCLNYTLKINETLNNALSLGNLEYGLLKLDMHEHEMSDIVEMVDSDLNDLYEKKDIVLRSSLQDGKIICDDYWLSQAIENIVKNSIEYSPRGETVLITCKTEPSTWHIMVTDHGPGFGDQDPNMSFDRYYFSNHKHSEVKNHGLGLAISKQVVKHHYGNLWACNGEEGGAEFHILLPFLDSDTILPS